MNRAEATRQVLLLEAAAKQIKARAAVLRSDLDADARAELTEQGTAPTWRLDIGTWSLPVSKEAAYVADEAALLDWVRQFHPTEVETTERVRPAFLTSLLPDCMGDEGGVVWMREGALVPGLAMRPGGVPKTLTFRPAGDAQAVADQMADKLVADLTAALGVSDQ